MKRILNLILFIQWLIILLVGIALLGLFLFGKYDLLVGGFEIEQICFNILWIFGSFFFVITHFLLHEEIHSPNTPTIIIFKILSFLVLPIHIILLYWAIIYQLFVNRNSIMPILAVIYIVTFVYFCFCGLSLIQVLKFRKVLKLQSPQITN